jgi:exopolysaccharide production protein ExoZ
MGLINAKAGGVHEKFLGIQSARGFAALAVTLFHAIHGISLDQYVGYAPFKWFFSFAHSGVDFFFVLSGFIIYFAHHADIGQPSALPRYVWRRVTRIYPIYWVITGFVILLAIFRPGGGHGLEAEHVLKSVLLLPQSREPLIGVAWTLEHEMLFYLAFSLFIVGRRLGAILFILWTCLIVGVAIVRPSGELLRFLGSSYHLQFFMGVAAGHAVLNLRISWPRLLAFFGLLAFFSAGMMENAGFIAWGGLSSQLLFGSTATCIVFGLAAAERQGFLHIGPASVFLGDASYSLYLTHTITIGLTARVLMIAGVIKLLPGWFVLIIVTVTAVIAAGLVYRFIERPLASLLGTIGRSYIYAPRQRSGLRPKPIF